MGPPSGRAGLHIGLVYYGRLDTVSGGYLYDRRLVAHLGRRGDRVELISLPWTGYGRHLLHNLHPGLFRRLRRTRCDLLLQDELNHPSLFWLNARLRRQVTTPIVTIVHHLRCSERRPAWQNGLYRLVERRYLESVDACICNSQTTRQVVAALCRPRPMLVAYPGGDRLGPALPEPEIVARAGQPGPLQLLFVGNLIPRKGLHRLLTAVASLPVGSWQLTVVGNRAVAPAYTSRVRRQIEAAGLAPHVTMAGPLSDAALAAAMRRSHVLAVPSSYEGFGIVYLEGMGAGLPAIAGADGAAHELITEGENGFLVADQAVLAQRLAVLQADRARLAAMSVAARRRFLAHPTWDQTAEAIRRFLLELAAAPMRAGGP